ncbi:MAG TPA: MipA/OmpV family protein [Nitrospiraceae bacterium]|jgi:outer membrane scaffolding protein for murein synthesis (MipA/OmpV family)|nr:MipA/OmpV family protein [Nitrospiraceae bacterium]
MKKIILGLFAVVFALSMFTAAAQAASGLGGGGIAIDNVPNIVGVAVGMLPDYVGSHNYTFGAAPFVKYSFEGNMYVRLLATDLQVNLIDHPVLRFGPAFNYRLERSDVENSQVSAMKKIDGAFEAGAFVGAEMPSASNPRQRFIVNFEWLDDVSNKYAGYNFTLSASYWYPVSMPLDLFVGGGFMYADKNFMQTYFGVTPSDSFLSRLPVYTASAGIENFSLLGGGVYHLSKEWHVLAGLRFQRLLDDANNSPVVANVGSASQFVLGVGAAYSW